MKNIAQYRVAIVHDWLIAWAGAEKVLEQMLEIWPDADIFCMVDSLSETQSIDCLKGRKIRTSFVQRMPLSKRHHRVWLPIMPIAVEQFDLSDYDLVISSSHAVAKGVITGPDTYHLCYCHSPMRYAWDLQGEYLKPSKSLLTQLKQIPMRYLLHRLRLWDFASSHRPDTLVGNSAYIARRIEKCYRRRAQVIHPPVNTQRLEPYYTATQDKKDYYIMVSRLVPYKRIPLVAEAFASMSDKKLVIIGDGPERARLQSQLATYSSEITERIQYLGYQDDETLFDYLRQAKAMLFAAEEDFGILPVEAQALGTPVIAYGKGGARETVIDGKTGLFFDEPNTASIVQAVERFEQTTWDSQACQENASRFANEVFKQQLSQLVACGLKGEATSPHSDAIATTSVNNAH